MDLEVLHTKLVGANAAKKEVEESIGRLQAEAGELNAQEPKSSWFT